MADYSLEAKNTLIVGMMGSGKTTFALRLMLNSPTACNFIFDDEDRTAPRLGLRPSYTLAQLDAALASRWVAFNPARMFPPEVGDRDIFSSKKRAFAFFCAWVFQCCGRGPGEKIVSLPEIWRFCTPDSIPPEFASLAQMGRELGIHLVMDTQRPERVNSSIIGAATELVAFRLISPDALKTVGRLGVDPAAVGSLPLGTFLAVNRLTGSKLSASVF